jgi:hypothetical protein
VVEKRAGNLREPTTKSVSTVLNEKETVQYKKITNATLQLLIVLKTRSFDY